MTSLPPCHHQIMHDTPLPQGLCVLHGFSSANRIFPINVHNSLQCLLPIFAQMKLPQCGPPDTLLNMTDHPSHTQLIVLLQHPIKGLGIPSCTLFAVLHLSLSFGTQAYSCFLFLLIRHKYLKQCLMNVNE